MCKYANDGFLFYEIRCSDCCEAVDVRFLGGLVGRYKCFVETSITFKPETGGLRLGWVTCAAGLAQWPRHRPTSRQ
jgi:hypothetical protein